MSQKTERSSSGVYHGSLEAGWPHTQALLNLRHLLPRTPLDHEFLEGRYHLKYLPQPSAWQHLVNKNSAIIYSAIISLDQELHVRDVMGMR